mmetsp:Transcript_138690/g.276565  ORF Transcript_138690/g.276565 Transcript_138690/m.276565 type:complete len:209 (+) Transcript_138690:1376-2002(+)
MKPCCARSLPPCRQKFRSGFKRPTSSEHSVQRLLKNWRLWRKRRLICWGMTTGSRQLKELNLDLPRWHVEVCPQDQRSAKLRRHLLQVRHSDLHCRHVIPLHAPAVATALPSFVATRIHELNSIRFEGKSRIIKCAAAVAAASAGTTGASNMSAGDIPAFSCARCAEHRPSLRQCADFVALHTGTQYSSVQDKETHVLLSVVQACRFE